MSHDDGLKEHQYSLPEPICVQYSFSQLVPTGQGISTQIRLLSVCDTLFITVHGDRDVLVWDLTRNAPPQRVEIDFVMDRITGIAFSPSNNNVIAVSFQDGAEHGVFAYDWSNKTTEAVFGTGSDFHSVQFSPDGRLLAWISAGSIDVWETIVNTHVITLREGKNKTNGLPVSKFAFTPDSKEIATLDRSGRMTTWDVPRWLYLKESRAKAAWDGVGREAMQLVADGRRVMASCRQTDGTSPWTWRLTTWWPENGGRGELEMNGCAFAWLPRHGAFVATVQADGGRLRIRDARNGVCLDQSTQGIAKTGKTPLVVAATIAVGDRVMVTQIANGRTTVWHLTAAIDE
ncbi:WD-40 repeat protein [Colletotrichum truncatum]|uniref:WD-40 repeat protein n=1 Tax=Colletotrichum truncatum TaxID=5467 RepID=A0ACC3Z7D9_COLTU|nr:WD-40 repeat protein [Colletotrichum truncatum]KAF6785350.1 WD-40 repeat protein [Colletotrichum truncatum]